MFTLRLLVGVCDFDHVYRCPPESLKFPDADNFPVLSACRRVSSGFGVSHVGPSDAPIALLLVHWPFFITGGKFADQTAS